MARLEEIEGYSAEELLNGELATLQSFQSFNQSINKSIFIRPSVTTLPPTSPNHTNIVT
jgi:hypothetical protein